MAEVPPQKVLNVLTWNVAAINNNPFEYYLTLEGEYAEDYARLMESFQNLIESPSQPETTVGQVFTPAMWGRMKEAMTKCGWERVDEVGAEWSKYAEKPIITGFLKDKALGSKRLASMPDRFTNTINCSDKSVVCRPTIINNYKEKIVGVEDWFNQWYHFMFEQEVSVMNRSGQAEMKPVWKLLQPIKKAKYPDVTEEEEAMSLPLQTLCLAIFDAILVHLISAAATPAGGKAIDWYGMKMKICEQLVINKQDRLLDILFKNPEYQQADIIFLQEVSGSCIEELQGESRFWEILVPKDADYVRDQNSVILVSKRRVEEDQAEDASAAVAAALPEKTPVAAGDICAFFVTLLIGREKMPVLISSFHGDTAGLASTPVVNAVRQCARERKVPLLMGLDANTHIHEGKNVKEISEFLEDLKAGDEPIKHTWGEPKGAEDWQQWVTTCNARSYLQPQLNKAVPYEQRQTSRAADRNPKDYVLFSPSFFDLYAPAIRDNTGETAFKEGLDLPTLDFPSDHAIVWSKLAAKV